MSDTEVFTRIKDTYAVGGTLTQGEARWLVGEVLAMQEDLRAATRQRDTAREVGDQWDAKWRQEIEQLRQQVTDSEHREIAALRRAGMAEQALAEAKQEAERCRKLWLGLQSRLDPECYEHAQERLTVLLEAEQALATERAQRTDLLEEINSLTELVGELRTALDRCQWGDSGGVDGPGYCPVCGWTNPEHRPDCLVEAARARMAWPAKGRTEIAQLREQLATERAGAKEMRRVLASIQYCQQVSGTVSLCPICDQPDTRDHAPDCTILAALATEARAAKGREGVSDAIGPRRNYWEWAAGELEEEKQMLRQQVTALTTENANLAALVEEYRKAAEHLMAWCGDKDWSTPKLDLAITSTELALARTPEQAEARRAALEDVARCAAWWVQASDRYYEQKTAGWESEDQTREMANEKVSAEEATEAALVALAALEVKRG